MPSSTSSSEIEAQRAEGRRFTRAALAWAAVCLAIYGGWFAWAAPEVQTFQNCSARNVSRAEHFLHGEGYQAVLVGSSLTQLIPPEALGEAVYNMGFSRESSLTGLSIAAQAPRLPEVLVIEVNYILREANEAFVAGRLAPLGFALKDTASVFQIAAQPMNVILSALRSGYGRSVAQKMNDTVDTATLSRLLEGRVKEFGDRPDPELLAAAIATLSAQVDTLIARGCTPMMLLMPVEPALEETVYAQTIRQALEAAFPSDRFHWVDTARPTPYRTTDSEHLLYADAWDVGERITAAVTATVGAGQQEGSP